MARLEFEPSPSDFMGHCTMLLLIVCIWILAFIFPKSYRKVEILFQLSELLKHIVFMFLYATPLFKTECWD